MKGIRKHADIMLLFLILVVGFIKRINYPIYSLNLDIGRDLFIAKHYFSSINTTFFLRPESTWILLPNTPFYFWIITLLYAFTQSFYGTIFVHSLVQTSLIFIVFLAVKNLSGKIPAIFAAFLVSTSRTFVAYATTMAQFSLIPVFVAWSFLHLTYAYTDKNRHPTHLYLSILCFLPALLLHNSSIPLFMAFSVVWIIFSAAYSPKVRLHVICLLIFFVDLYLLLSYQTNFYLLFEIPRAIMTSQHFPMYNLYDRLVLLFSFINQGLWQPPQNLIIALGAIALYAYSHRRSTKKLLLLFVPLSGIIVSLAVPIAEFYDWYIIAPFLILITILIATSLSVFTRPKHAAILLLFLVGYLIAHRWLLLQPYVHQDPFQAMKKVSAIIASKSVAIHSETPTEYVLPLANNYNLPHLSPWFGPSAFLFLPNGASTVRIVDPYISANNIERAHTPPNIVLICIDDPNNSFLTHENCMEDWKKYAKVSPPISLGVTEAGGITYSIYEVPKP